MKAEPPPLITFIGCGNMGQALLSRWLESNISADYCIIKPTPLPQNFISEKLHSIESIEKGEEPLARSALIILAIKPQMMRTICAQLKPRITSKTPILSIAAGQTLGTLEFHLHQNQPIIRAMPNTPTKTGKGATVCIANKKASQTTKTLINTLFTATGFHTWITDESLMNAITALSASGPAYLFYMMQALSDAGIKTGLPKELAENLAKQTIIGASALAEQSQETPETLRKKITSQKGVTEAALEILMDGRLENILEESLKANIKRGKELNT